MLRSPEEKNRWKKAHKRFSTFAGAAEDELYRLPNDIFMRISEFVSPFNCFKIYSLVPVFKLHDCAKHAKSDDVSNIKGKAVDWISCRMGMNMPMDPPLSSVEPKHMRGVNNRTTGKLIAPVEYFNRCVCATALIHRFYERTVLTC